MTIIYHGVTHYPTAENKKKYYIVKIRSTYVCTENEQYGACISRSFPMPFRDSKLSLIKPLSRGVSSMSLMYMYK